MKLIGLTGGSGSGKTTAAKCFSNGGASVIDADAVARTVVLPGTDALNRIKTDFGAEYINEDGTLNRSKLGRLVFSDAEQLQRLNQIMIPAILEEINAGIRNFGASGVEIAVLDAPLLFEYHLDQICDLIVIMKTPLSTRMERLQNRDGLSEFELKQRIASQADFSSFFERADYLLDATDAACLKRDVERILSDLKGVKSCV